MRSRPVTSLRPSQSPDSRRPLGALRGRAAALAALAALAVASCDREPATVGSVAQPLVQNFAAGSLVIPMDTTYQAAGTLKAFGLVHRLLKSNVAVSWAINPLKIAGGSDFTASGKDLQTNAAVNNYGYRGGPFVIDAADRATALPIIQAWQANNTTTVHDMQAFSADIFRKLTSAPKFAVFVDGNEIIAFRYLNAAGILDSAGQAWPTVVDGTGAYNGYPDVLSVPEVRGANVGGAADGALIGPGGAPAFCHLTSMHYTIPADEEAVREVRQWLTARPTTHAFMECEAIHAFETAANGHFLSTAGLQDDGATANPPVNLLPANPYSQIDGTWVVQGGATDSIGLANGSAYVGNVDQLFRTQGAAQGTRLAWMSGVLDGNVANGKLSYLAGHEYSTNGNVGVNTDINGVRLFLNSLFESTCAQSIGEPTITFTKSAPAFVNGNQITFTLNYKNDGPGYAESVVIKDGVPAGTSFVSATNGGALANGIVSWNIGTVAPGATGSVSFTVSANVDATIVNVATFNYNIGLTPRTITSNSTSTVRDTVPPDTSIVSGPSGTVNSASATFDFNSPDAPNVTYECSLDGAAYVACTDPVTFNGLADGSHTLNVRAKDLAGNVDPSPATRTWTIDTVTLDTFIDSGPAAQSASKSATFAFSSNKNPVTYECSLDGAAFAACGSPVTFNNLADGSHTLSVRAKDVNNNVDATPASRTWIVDTVAPDTTIVSGPSGSVSSTSATFSFNSNEAPNVTYECSLDGAAFVACSNPVTFNNLAQGPHKLDVRAKDLAGNVDPSPATQSWTVDTLPPDTSIVSGPSGSVASTSATFAFNSPEAPNVTYECSLDGAAFVPCTNPVTFNNLAQSNHTLAVRAKDLAGNVDPSPATQSWTVDTVAPDTSIVSGPSGTVNTTSATFAFNSPEAPNVTYECSLDGAAFAPCTNPVTFNGLGQGSHTLDVRAKDLAGNIDPSPATRTWTVDTVAPDTFIDSGPSGTTASKSATFAFSSNEQGVTYECSLDGAAFAACANPVTFNNLADGQHTLNVRAKDQAGNVDPSPATRTWTVDSSLPDTFIDSGPSGAGNPKSATFTFSSDKPNVTYECSLDGAAFAACGSPVTFNNLADGSHTLAVRARNQAGSVDPSPATRTWSVDATPPDTTIDLGPNGTVADKNAVFAFSSNENPVTYECSLDGAAFAACANPLTLQNLADGQHTLSVRAKDQAGNVDTSPATRTWTVDTTAPDTSILSGPSGPTNNPSATFGFSSNENNVTYECSLDGGAFVACSNPATFNNLADGPHLLAVRAKDQAGNVDTTPATRSFTVDTGPPDTFIVTAPAQLTTQKSATFNFASNEMNVTYECSLDGGAYAACSNPVTFNNLADGSHTLNVRAKDQAGNVDASPASYKWTVDSTAPDTFIDSGPTGTVPQKDATFAFSSNEPGVTYECSLDNGGFAPCNNPAIFGNLADGPHTLAVRARDAAGNVDPSPATRTWTVDNTPPDTTIVSGPSGPTSNASPVFDFSSNENNVTYECSLDGKAFVACSDPATFANLPDGPHTLAVRAKDAAGNVDPTPANASFTVDTKAPDTFIDLGPSGTVAQKDATFVFSSDEQGVTYECSLDGAPFAACNNPLTLKALADGPHKLDVRAKDAAGNVDATPATRSWVIDTVPIDTTIDMGPSGLVATKSATFAFSSNKNPVTYECSLDGSAFTPCPTPVTFNNLAEGNHVLLARAKDQQGNVDPTPALRSWSVDTVAPETVIESGPQGVVGSRSAPFDFSSNEPNVTYECSVDGGAYAACTDPVTFANLADGPHTLSVRAKDPAGNVDATPATRSWIVDLVPLDTFIDSGPKAVTSDKTAAFAFSSNKMNVTYECELDGGGFMACMQMTSFANLAEGKHLLSVRAKDQQGNVDPTPATLGWVVDATPPDTIIADGPAEGATVGKREVPFDFAATEPGVTYECNLDGGGFMPCTDPATFTGLADGPHTLEVRARDAAGNVDPSPARRSFTVDLTAVDTFIDLGPSGTVAENFAVFVFSSNKLGATYECNLDGGGFVPCQNLTSYANLAEGKHTLEVRATDALGNKDVDATPATRTWTIDTGIGDKDGDGIPDGKEKMLGTDANNPDTDKDGILDGVEVQTGTDPLDDDTDDDGILDGNEDGNHNGVVDAGETDPRKADSDNDGLQDGTEEGLSQPQGKNTDPMKFIPDADPLTTTDPLDRDTDDGSVFDGVEDSNHNGKVDKGESDPLVKEDDKDADGDGIDNDTEKRLGLDPFDADSDDDGVPDGMDGINDTDGDGKIDALDPDSDNDGLNDGTELGVTAANAPKDTDLKSPNFVPDADPNTKTDPKNADSDKDGLKDGVEDKDHNGRVDGGETDPNNPDTDKDGLKDGVEVNGDNKTNPLNPDTDGDGLTDGEEDRSGNGKVDAGETDPTNPDTDGDGLKDGVEVKGGNPTNPLNPDSDGDGLTDGHEDKNGNGMKDAGETDPNFADTDKGGIPDGEEEKNGGDPLNALDDYRVIGSGCSTGGGLRGDGGTGNGGLLLFGGLLLVGFVLRARRLPFEAARSSSTRGGLRGARSVRGALVAAVIGLVGTVAGGEARAQKVLDSTQIDVQQFKPGAGFTDLLTLHGAGVSPHLSWRLGVWGNYASNPLVLENAQGQTVFHIIGSQTTFDVVGALSLWNRLEVAAALPVFTYQTSENAPQVSPKLASGVASTGIGDLRLVPKVNILDASGFRLGLSVTLVLPTGDSSAFLSSGFNVQPRLLGDYTFGSSKVRLVANVGINVRPSSQTFSNLTVGNELSYGAGLEVPFHLGSLPVDAIGTLHGAVGLEQTDREEAPLELLLAARLHVLDELALTLGAGPGLTKGYGTPDVRIFGGLTWDPWRGKKKPCDLGPEDMDGYQDDDNCLDPDNDGDGILDVNDKCPNVPENKNGYQDDDGCPEEPPPDSDGDGLTDDKDVCPKDKPGKLPDARRPGCPMDRDGDTVADELDACPEVPRGNMPDPARPGCPADRDLDGVPDEKDLCPDVPQGRYPDPAKLGCPAPDRDGDSVVDTIDACPDKAGAPDPDPKKNGCPGLVVVKDGMIVLLAPVFFATNKDIILPKSFPVLTAVANALKVDRTIKKVSIEGHTDSRGKFVANMALSDRRANSCMRWLIAHGIEASRLEAHGYGPTRPIADNKTDAGRAKNRRTDFRVVDPPPPGGTKAGATTVRSIGAEGAAAAVAPAPAAAPAPAGAAAPARPLKGKALKAALKAAKAAKKGKAGGKKAGKAKKK